MFRLVANGALLLCDSGLVASSLIVPQRYPMVEYQQVANVEDHVAGLNIMPFGMCSSLANPTVAAATASTGALTPMPCFPMTHHPWMPGSLLMTEDVGGREVALVHENCTCFCTWAGLIRVIEPNCFVTCAY